MTKLNDLSAAQLEWIIDIKHRIEILQIQLDSIGGDAGTGRPKAKRKTSAAGRPAIAAAVLG